MSLRTVTGSIAVSVAAFLVLQSCSNNPSGNAAPPVKSTLTAGEQQDLVKMANTITGIISLSELSKQGSAEEVPAKKKADIMYECNDSTPGVTACTYQHEYGTDIDTLRYYSDASKTAIISDLSALPAGSYYYMEMHMIYIDSSTKGDILMSLTEKVTDYSQFVDTTTFEINLDAMYNAMESTASFTGTMNYYHDDLVLEFYETSYTLKNGKMSGIYNFKIMDGKYTVTMTFETSFQEVAGLDETSSVTFQGPILNGNGEKIGLFTVNSFDGSVKIYDNQNNLVKTAG
jgi:hypothetical protein